MAKAFVIAETKAAAAELTCGARTLAEEVVIVSVGDVPTGVADTAFHIEIPAGNVADDAYVTVNRLFDESGATIVLAEPSLHVLSLVGRLAAHLGAATITGVSAFEDLTATSMYFGGTGVRKARATGEVSLFTVGAGVFDGSAATGTDSVEEVAFEAPDHAVVKTGTEALPESDVNLAGAEAIVACGRGFADEADLALARDLAAKLGAEVGCTRPLAEGADWFPREAYVGVSGAVVSPKTYVAVGISGQMQHMVGCNGSETIIAVNKDKNAPIFKQCDYGFAGDLKTVLPALTAAL